MLRRSRHLIARLLAVTMVCAVPFGVSACANHHLLSKAFCLYNVDRAFHDFRTGHKIYGALNVALAIHNCRAGFAPNSH
jgi:hypothetical protein